MSRVSVLIPTCDRPAALAVTLTCLYFQEFEDFDVVIADQSENALHETKQPVAAPIRLLEGRGVSVTVARNRPHRGMAQQRQFLLEHAKAPRCLFLDDDVILEPFVIGLLERTLAEAGCGFAGNAVIGLSHRDDVRPDEQFVDLWEGAVKPERVTPSDPEWQRHKLHNAANLWHVQQQLGASVLAPLRYKVAWVGGCVMYDTAKLRDVGGFEFWRQLPVRHCGEDVLAQLRVAAAYGGCGVMPSGAFHQELETTLPDRRTNAPYCLNV